MSKSPLVASYEAYLQTQGRLEYNVFGEELLKYIKAIVAKDFGSQFYFVEDAIGESSIKILEQLPTFDPNKSPLPVWVKVIVRNTCKDLLRGNQVDKQKAEEVPLQEADRSYDFFSNHDNRIALKQLTAKLSKPDRDLVQAKLDGLTDEEIAHNYGVTQQAINLRWLKVVEHMRTLAGVDNNEN